MDGQVTRVLPTAVESTSCPRVWTMPALSRRCRAVPPWAMALRRASAPSPVPPAARPRRSRRRRLAVCSGGGGGARPKMIKCEPVVVGGEVLFKMLSQNCVGWQPPWKGFLQAFISVSSTWWTVDVSRTKCEECFVIVYITNNIIPQAIHVSHPSLGPPSTLSLLSSAIYMQDRGHGVPYKDVQLEDQ